MFTREIKTFEQLWLENNYSIVVPVRLHIFNYSITTSVFKTAAPLQSALQRSNHLNFPSRPENCPEHYWHGSQDFLPDSLSLFHSPPFAFNFNTSTNNLVCVQFPPAYNRHGWCQKSPTFSCIWDELTGTVGADFRRTKGVTDVFCSHPDCDFSLYFVTHAWYSPYYFVVIIRRQRDGGVFLRHNVSLVRLM